MGSLKEEFSFFFVPFSPPLVRILACGGVSRSSRPLYTGKLPDSVHFFAKQMRDAPCLQPCELRRSMPPASSEWMACRMLFSNKGLCRICIRCCRDRREDVI